MVSTEQPDAPTMERLAAQEHASWAGWAKWMLGQIEEELVGLSPVDPRSMTTLRSLAELSCIQRWRRQINTDYAELSEKEKESDRKEVREKWPLYTEESFAAGAAFRDRALLIGAHFETLAAAVLCEDAADFVLGLIERAKEAGLASDGRTLTAAGREALS